MTGTGVVHSHVKERLSVREEDTPYRSVKAPWNALIFPVLLRRSTKQLIRLTSLRRKPVYIAKQQHQK